MPAIPHISEVSSVWFDKIAFERAEKNYNLAAVQATGLVSETVAETGASKATKLKKSQVTGSSSKQDKEAKKVAVVPTQKACTGSSSSAGNLSYLADEIARARQHIKNSLQCDGPLGDSNIPSDEVSRLNRRIQELESKNSVSDIVNALQSHISKLESRVAALEKLTVSSRAKEVTKEEKPSAMAKASSTSSAAVKKEDDDDVDLFGSDDEDDEENEKLKQERLKAYEAKKSKKPALIAKSNVILDVKPWDDETDMKEMERKVREIKFDGLVWGASKLVPLAYGIQKLQISCVVEDEKVSVDLLQEHIEGLEDLVQSMDIAAFNKV